MHSVGLSLAWIGGSLGAYLAALQLVGVGTRGVPLVWLTIALLLAIGLALLSGARSVHALSSIPYEP